MPIAARPCSRENRIVAALRGHFAARDFVEVEAAALQVSPGNEAHLSAFATSAIGHDGAASPLYLHTSPEFACKKLLAAGETRLFSLARVFRNCERGPLHHPEFTMLEWYRAGQDYEVLMRDCADILALAADEAKTRSLRFRGRESDPFADFERLTLAEAFERHADIDLLATIEPGGRTDRDGLAAGVVACGLRVAADDTWADLFSRVLVALIEPKLGDGRPTLLYEYPVSEAALARPSARDPRVAERFELYACGVELANAFGELTDPHEQRRRFEIEMVEKARIYGRDLPDRRGFPLGPGHHAGGERHRTGPRQAGHARGRRAAHRRRDLDAGRGDVGGDGWQRVNRPLPRPLPRSLRNPAQLVEAGLVAPSDLSALEAVAARYAVSVTPDMAELIDPTDPADPIARQFLPRAEELVTRAEEDSDPIGDAAHSPLPGLVHRYPDRVLLKPLHVCPVYCRFCFRREMVGPDGLGTLSEDELAAAFAYIADRPDIWEVILTGGDPFALSARRLGQIAEALGLIPHVKVLRIHTRVPVVEPARVDDDLVVALKRFGGAVYVALHANHPRDAFAICQKKFQSKMESVLLLLILLALLRLNHLIIEYIDYRLKWTRADRMKSKFRSERVMHAGGLRLSP